VCFASTILACSSLPDLTFGDAGSSGSSGSSGASGQVPGCTPSGAEICDDGADNDCDGEIDCADSADCGARACVAAPPDGWQYVGFDATPSAGCPAAFGASEEVKIVDGDGLAGACVCDCGGSCADGESAVEIGDAACAAGTTTTVNVKSDTGGTCTPLASSLAVPAPAGGHVTSPALACNPKVSVKSAAAGRVCAAPTSAGGCGASQVCAPKGAQGFGLCISKPGVNACPPGFAQRHTAGASANDARACGACTCGSTPCSGSVTIFSDDKCMTNGAIRHAATLPAGGACASLADDGFSAIRYTSKMTGGCSVSSFSTAATGSIAFDAERTICCP
jgi:hypothetical protein